MTERPAVMDIVCGMRGRMQLAMAVLFTMGVLLGLSLLVVSPGDDAYPLVIIDLIMIVVFLLLFGLAFWYCTNRAMHE